MGVITVNDNQLKRMLYCRSSIIVTLLDSGMAYRELPELFQIFISKTDFLHTGKAVVYNEKPYSDGVTEIHFNLTISNGASPPLRKLQKYFLNTISANESTYFPKLVARVNFLKYEEGGLDEMCDVFDEVHQEGYAEGRMEACQDTILELLSSLGKVSKRLTSRIRDQKDEQYLRSWVKLTAHASSVRDFTRKI